MQPVPYISERYPRLVKLLIKYVNSNLFERDVEHIMLYDDTVGKNLAKECAIDQMSEEILREQLSYL